MTIGQYLVFGKRYAKGLSEKLIAYYDFNFSSIDLINGQNGTDTNISYSTGINNSCASFNGSNSLISIPQSTNFDFSNASSDVPFSMSFWVNFSAGGATTQEMICKYNGASAQWLIRRQSNYIAVALFSSSSIYKYWQYASASLSLGTWNHIVISYNGLALDNSLSLYINGANVSPSGSISNVGSYTKMPITVQPTIIGNRGGGASAYYSGKIDELAVWRDRKIVLSEVSELWNLGVGKFYPL